MNLKNKLEDYTEAEFLSLLNKIWAVDVSEEEHDNLIDHFEKLSEHPNGNGLIFYPSSGQDDSPEGIVKQIKEWRAKNGKPDFKK
ncbi:bacteriocin immunity protein [Photorhabdus antumapuensis]|uniref:bacteriocin immunity protein n=1 Tax=Photorhabdus antumapuensis TaxID=2862867 RepID=UPI001CEC95B9|nr:bacteriocin immunity protein [Photorhabdus antumapuensis]MCA6223100.1 bacteriocin immunity protein [Photorhabdus antumapuensis]